MRGVRAGAQGRDCGRIAGESECPALGTAPNGWATRKASVQVLLDPRQLLPPWLKPEPSFPPSETRTKTSCVFDISCSTGTVFCS